MTTIKKYKGKNEKEALLKARADHLRDFTILGGKEVREGLFGKKVYELKIMVHDKSYDIADNKARKQRAAQPKIDDSISPEEVGRRLLDLTNRMRESQAVVNNVETAHVPEPVAAPTLRDIVPLEETRGTREHAAHQGMNLDVNKRLGSLEEKFDAFMDILMKEKKQHEPRDVHNPYMQQQQQQHRAQQNPYHTQPPSYPNLQQGTNNPIADPRFYSYDPEPDNRVQQEMSTTMPPAQNEMPHAHQRTLPYEQHMNGYAKNAHYHRATPSRMPEERRYDPYTHEQPEPHATCAMPYHANNYAPVLGDAAPFTHDLEVQPREKRDALPFPELEEDVFVKQEEPTERMQWNDASKLKAPVHKEPEIAQEPALRPEIEEHLLLLRRRDFSDTFIERMRNHLTDAFATESTCTETALKKEVKRYIEKNLFLETGISTKQTKKRIIALVGTTGVGKTTTIPKLAYRFLDEKREIHFHTFDCYRIAAEEQLRRYANILRVNFGMTKTAEAFREEMLKIRGDAVIFVDTIGRSHNNGDQIAAMADYFKNAGKIDVETHLVISATTKYYDTLDIINHFSVFDYKGVIITKIDETNYVGGVISAITETQKPIRYLTFGQSVPKDIIEGKKGKSHILGKIYGE